MFFAFTPFRIATMSLILAVLFVSVYSTFAYTTSRFGSLKLPYALERMLQKNFLLAWYSLNAPQAGATDTNRFAAAAGSLVGMGGERSFENGAPTDSIPVLVYHRLLDDGNNVSRDAFADQLFTLKQAGWQSVTYQDFAAFMHGEKDLAEKSFLITFDDGAKDSYYPSDPILNVAGFNAVNFILPKHSAGDGTYYYLSAGEIRTMLESGRWEVQSHGQDSHDFYPINAEGTEGAALSNRIWRPEDGRAETPQEYTERVTHDLRSAKEDIQKTFGVNVTGFAFPFGEFGLQSLNYPESSSVLKSVAQQTYDFVFYQTWRGEGFSHNYPTGDHKGAYVKRIRVEPTWSGDELLAVLERGTPKDIPYTDSFDTDNGWFSTWGLYRVVNGTLRMQSKPGETGNAVILDGTGHWRDYTLKATVESPNKTGILLWARFKDNQQNAACNFGTGFVHVEEILNGQRNVIKGERREDILIPDGQFTVEARVNGRTLGCYLNGEKIVETEFLDHSLERGGIGIKIWDEIPGVSSLIVHELTVSRPQTATSTP